jgi:hypothetical protein
MGPVGPAPPNLLHCPSAELCRSAQPASLVSRLAALRARAPSECSSRPSITGCSTRCERRSGPHLRPASRPSHAPAAAGPRRSGHLVPAPLQLVALLLPQRQCASARAHDSSSPPVARALGALCVPQLRARRRRRAQSSQPSFSAVSTIGRFRSRRPPPLCSRIGVPAPGLYVVVSARRSTARCASRSTVSVARRSRRSRSQRPAPAFVGLTDRRLSRA